MSVGEAVAVGSSRSRVSRELGEEGADAERCDALTRSLDPGFVVRSFDPKMPRTLVTMALVVGLRPTLSSHLPLSVTLCLCAALTVGSTVV